MLPEHQWFIKAVIRPCSTLSVASRKPGNQLVSGLPSPLQRMNIFHCGLGFWLFRVIQSPHMLPEAKWFTNAIIGLAAHSGVPSGCWETNWWRFYRHRCRERAFSISGVGFCLIWVTQSPHMLPELNDSLMPSSDLAVHSGVPSGSWETNWWRFYRHRCRERAFSISGLGFWLIWVTQSPHMLPEHKWFTNAIIGPCSALGGAFRKLGNQLVKVLPAPMSRTSIFHFWAGILINPGNPEPTYASWA